LTPVPGQANSESLIQSSRCFVDEKFDGGQAERAGALPRSLARIVGREQDAGLAGRHRRPHRLDQSQVREHPVCNVSKIPSFSGHKFYDFVNIFGKKMTISSQNEECRYAQKNNHIIVFFINIVQCPGSVV
jgi:hypothetical protein